MHEFEFGLLRRQGAGVARVGTVVADKALKAEKALVMAGLDWEVEKIPLLGIYTQPNGTEMEIDVPLSKAVIRTDRMETLGVVGRDFGLVQNLELLEFCEALQDTDEAIIHTAGSLKGGRVVWGDLPARQGRDDRRHGGREDRSVPLPHERAQRHRGAVRARNAHPHGLSEHP